MLCSLLFGNSKHSFGICIDEILSHLRYTFGCSPLVCVDLMTCECSLAKRFLSYVAVLLHVAVILHVAVLLNVSVFLHILVCFYVAAVFDVADC